MADVSAPTLILFIASLVIAAGVSGVLINTVTDISSALDDRGADVSKNIRTDVEVISDSESSVYDDGSGNLTLYVKNTGDRTLPATGETFDVIVDAQYRTDVTVTVADGNTDWAPHGVVKVVVGGLSLDSGDHRVKLVVDGDEETFRFRT
ncbi:flagellar protein FlaG [Halogeometricum rufum]|uniref:Flagellar protein FlaG n=1 Tax=Halogeometricum rufum TaxID=553469 RepID=A0A1I6GS68_9EURY|nr:MULTISPECIES: flagellar protein G [Halogeometricum]MUV58439.1 flagellar protein G [Halogeometricum sp. CBA1124]SFR45075.1 flagellar protein FlaG [Halogeometricum rufum]